MREDDQGRVRGGVSGGVKRMTVLAHGVDLVEVSRVARIRQRHAERFLTRVFTAKERDYALESRRADERLAARFAAKEAVMKALGTGLADGIRWTDIEVTRDDTGRPGIALHARAEAVAHGRGIHQWLLSLSHVRDTAMASAIGLGGGALIDAMRT